MYAVVYYIPILYIYHSCISQNVGQSIYKISQGIGDERISIYRYYNSEPTIESRNMFENIKSMKQSIDSENLDHYRPPYL